MKFRSYPHPQQYQRGFTLTELAIVLGVFGVFISGVWAAASAARQSMRVHQAFDGITAIVDNVRSYYVAQTVINGSASTLVPTFIKQGIIPANFISGQTTTCSGITTHFATSPWGTYDSCGTLRLCSWNSGTDSSCGSTALANAQTFAIEFINLDQPSCIALATGTNVHQIMGLSAVSMNGFVVSATSLPVSVATAKTKCSNASPANIVDFVYSIRAPST